MKGDRPLRRTLGTGWVGCYRLAVRGRNKLFSLLAGGAFDSFGDHTVLQLPIRLSGEQRMAIGSRVFVGAGSWLQVVGDGRGVALTIGDGSAIAGHCVLSATHSIRLGRDVALARNVYIADHTHAYDDPGRPIPEQGLADVRPIEIDDGAWLGQNVVVLPGVRIGRGSVVSANAVVTKDVPDYSLAVGAPARVVRRFGPREGEAPPEGTSSELRSSQDAESS
jgi:acetyltransferase-like isoleucine patch superfamily enzyme